MDTRRQPSAVTSARANRRQPPSTTHTPAEAFADSISSGFAGFWGGLPFWIIAITVMLMATYDFYDETVRKKN